MYGSPRYWCPPTGRIALDAGGFLADPGDPFGFDQALSTYNEIGQHRSLRAVAAPIRDRSGDVGAVLNLAVHRTMLSIQELVERYASPVQRTAETISAELGYR